MLLEIYYDIKNILWYYIINIGRSIMEEIAKAFASLRLCKATAWRFNQK